MEFGDRTVFSIQLELDTDYGGSWLYGRFCYWVNGTQVGDYKLGTSLRDVYFKMKWIVADRGNREGDRLCALQPDEAFHTLDKSLYGVDEYPQESWVPDMPARFEARPLVDVFDQWKMFLIQCHDLDLVMYKIVQEVKIHMYSLPAGLFDSVIAEAYTYLENLYNQSNKQ